MQARIGPYVVAIYPKWGVFWVRRGDAVWTLRAPWDEPLFSERYGYWKHRRFMGWRFGSREIMPVQPSQSADQPDR